jgi:hypothetical protein
MALNSNGMRETAPGAKHLELAQSYNDLAKAFEDNIPHASNKRQAKALSKEAARTKGKALKHSCIGHVQKALGRAYHVKNAHGFWRFLNK